jgi:preprotein translocase subunit SecG
MYFLVALLLIIVVIFGISSGMNSYATAQQAQAQIETAKVAQISSWGNLITILTLALVILVALMLIVGAVWILYKRSARLAASHLRSVAAPREEPQIGTGELTQLMMLLLLKSLQAPSNSNPHTLPAVREEEPTEELFPWLR